MSLDNRSSLFLVVALFVAGCNSNEVTRLRVENDSLRKELDSHRARIRPLTDVTVWMDSIDAGRNVILANMREGNRSVDLSSRLQGINQFVKMSEERLEVLQNALRSSKLESSSYLMLVDALKSEVHIRARDVATLNEELAVSKNQNQALTETVKIRSAEADQANRRASDKQEDLLLLEAKIQAMVNNFKVAEADAYYGRARAVEEIARRTKLAPRKRREGYKEALELYKKCLSLGKKEAGTDIARLEKKID